MSSKAHDHGLPSVCYGISKQAYDHLFLDFKEVDPTKAIRCHVSIISKEEELE